MTRPAFDKQLEALDALRSALDAGAAREQLRRALRDRNNYLVSRAAAIAAELKFEDLLPDLLAAFDRFFVEPVKSDPQCLAKNALAHALKDLRHLGAEPFLRGIVHVQMEPAWGGPADSAATLRSTCALALPDCHLGDIEVLTYLADGLADPDKLVRIDCAVAISQVGRPEGALLLRLKALLGDRESDVLGHCFAALLSLAPPDAVPFVSRFLNSADEAIQLEAASALAQCRDPVAIAALKEFWQDALLPLDVRRLLVIDLGASPLPDAAEFLLTIVAAEPAELAMSAVAALATSRFHATLRERIAAAVDATGNPHLRSVFAEHFHETP
jgi:hypothetical protein